MVRDSLDQMDSDNTQNIPSKSNRTHRSYDVTPQKQVSINLKSFIKHLNQLQEKNWKILQMWRLNN